MMGAKSLLEAQEPRISKEINCSRELDKEEKAFEGLHRGVIRLVCSHVAKPEFCDWEVLDSTDQQNAIKNPNG